MKLSRNYSVQSFSADKKRLETLCINAEKKIMAIDDLRAEQAQLRAAIHGRMQEIHDLALEARRQKRNSGVPMPPIVPAPTAKWTFNGEDFVELWKILNQVAGTELHLEGGYALEEFIWRIGEMEEFYDRITLRVQEARKAVDARHALSKKLRERMVEYRLNIIAKYPPNHPVSLGMPKLPMPEDDPPPVRLTGSWDAANGKVVLKWTPTLVPKNLKRYEVRQSSADPYDDDFERVFWMEPTACETTFEPQFAPGVTMRFKVYVVLQTENVSPGSNAVAIVRPWP